MESATSPTPTRPAPAPPTPDPPSPEPPPKPSIKPPGWLLILLLLGGGFGVWQVLSSSPPPTAQTNSQGPPPRPVETIALTRGEGVQQLQLLGQVEAGEVATIGTQVDGVVRDVLVREGDRVTPGMTIAILDDADFQLDLSEARARLAQERSILDRLLVGTRSEIIAQRQAELDAARARELEAEENLNSLIALQPDTIAQRRAELETAKVREAEARDNQQRISSLSFEGALSERASVEARSGADAARSERFRAQAALTAQETQSRQDIAIAQTQLDNARSERLRIAAVLAEAQAGPTPEEIAAQEGVVAAAQAAVDQAALGLQRTEIQASTSGVVQSRIVDPGNYVESSDPILTLVSDGQLDIFLEIPERSISQVSSGMVVSLTARALPDWQEDARITAIVPATDTNSRRQLVRVSLENPPADLLPGMAVRADLELPIETAGATDETFAIPRDALTRRGNNWFVFTVNDETATQLSVEVVSDLGEQVIISHPQLDTGESIVVRGGDGLQDGSSVKTVASDREEFIEKLRS
ncbi:MAG: efflux RND transporter periplasmic adaptor subunit [Cyanobacteriota bacterium]|nr:efflux RND transporter periplasmic adaptor subunit [Cyanobacteriota bacterium]